MSRGYRGQWLVCGRGELENGPQTRGQLRLLLEKLLHASWDKRSELETERDRLLAENAELKRRVDELEKWLDV